jgi:hypothetical protein
MVCLEHADTSAAVVSERSSDDHHPQPHHRPCPRQEGSGAFFCAHFWPPCRSERRPFRRINDTLTLLFDDDEEFESHHYAFHVSDAEFDAIFGRIREAKLAYGSAPVCTENLVRVDDVMESPKLAG